MARETATEIVQWDPNEETRAEAARLLEPGNEDELEKRFGSRLAFGTAGLRGPMGTGTNHMNDVVVIQSTQGFCAYLEEQLGREELQRRGVVIGYDHRKRGALSSKRFGFLSAKVFQLRGVPVKLFSEIVCTPFVPFAVDLYGAAGGIMVTASHNPKEDDGYKVYWGNGAQIIPPHDEGIATCIGKNLAPWDAEAYRGVGDEDGGSLGEDPLAEVWAAYNDRSKSGYCRFFEENKSGEPVVYTAMHGVGTPFVRKLFEEYGHPAPVLVEKQVEPDPEFPTVKFPNPEEGAGALELAFEAAEKAGSRLVLANDPDADRLAVAEKAADGSWTVFSGNDIGVLFADWEIRMARERGEDLENCYVLTTTVSSKMLRAMAVKQGLHFEETLTGFKWLGSRSHQIRTADPPHKVLFGYEEAIGFCIGDVVKDKDGVTAAAVMAEYRTKLSQEGKTLVSRLAELREEFGHFRQRNGYLIVPDPAITQRIFDNFINRGRYAMCIPPFRISDVRDLQHEGCDTSQKDLRPTLPTSSSPMITLTLANGCVLTLRASGTEPKLKYYIECVAETGDAAQSICDQVYEAVMRHILRPSEFGIEK